MTDTTKLMPCPTCGGSDLFCSEPVSAGGGHAPNFLPYLGGWFASATFHMIVCRTCGLTRFFADESGLAKLKDSKHWTPLNYLDDLKEL